jgi:hypothetical protein
LIENGSLFDEGQRTIRLWLWSLPERAGLSNPSKRCDHFPDILSTMGDPITAQASAKIDTRKEFD